MNAAGTTRWQKRKDHLLFLWGLYSGDVFRFLHWNLWGGRSRFNHSFEALIKDHKWCFIGGCNNSGTSVLHGLLKNTGEFSALEREGQFYTRVLTRGNRKGFERVWSEYLDDIYMDERNTKNELLRLLHDWMISLEHPVKKRIVDKTTLNAVRMAWLQNVFPDSYFIGIVRNGYAVVEGIKRKGRKNVARGAKHWNLVNKTMLTDSKKIKRFILVKYEDLVGQQELTSIKIADFLGIDRSVMQHTFTSKFRFNTVAGNNAQGIKNFNQESINRLDRNELTIIRQYASEMLDLFGYEP